MQKNNDYRLGELAETALINFLKKYHTVSESSVEDNKQNDIDCYVDGRSVSIKQQQKALETGNLCFELRVFDRYDKEWKDSTYNRPKDLYTIIVGSSIYAIKYADLTAYVERFGWDRVTRLSKFTVAKQIESGHRHINAENGLIALETLVESNVAKLLTNKFDVLENLSEVEGRAYLEATVKTSKKISSNGKHYGRRSA